MRNRRKRNITIVSLCCLLVFMAVGYAVLSQTLNINGTANLTGKWDIYIDSVTVKEVGGIAKSNAAEVSEDKLSANFSVELIQPGDYVEYAVVVKNQGTINAVLRKLIPTIESNNTDMLLTHSIIQGQILKAESATEFTVKVTFDERATEIASGEKSKFRIQLIYEQYDGNAENIDPSKVPVTANDCFEIDNNGIITNYDYNTCGFSVTVPEKVNGITVEKIDRLSLVGVDYFVSEGYYPRAVSNRIHINQSSDVDLTTKNITLNLFKSEEDKQAYLSTQKNTETMYKRSSTFFFVVDDFRDAKNIIVPMHSNAFPFTDDGERKYAADATHILYTLHVEGVEYYFVEDQASYDIAVEHWETLNIEDVNYLYLMTDPEVSQFMKTLEEQGVEPIDTMGVYFHKGDETLSTQDSLILEYLDFRPATGLKTIASLFLRPKELYLPSSLQTIEDSSFKATYLPVVSIPKSVTTIGQYAFNDMPETSKIIMEGRTDLNGMTLESSWNGSAQIVYK